MNVPRGTLAAAVTPLLLLVLACDPGPQPEKPTKLAIRPDTVTLAPRQALQFSTTPVSLSVTWSIAEDPLGGTVTQTGLYTAPGVSGVFHVVATAVAAPALSATAVVTVDSGIVVAAPTPQAFDACVAKKLVATVTGSSDTGVIWAVDPGCGTLAPDGVTFTPVRGNTTCTAEASSHADPGKFAVVEIQATERILAVGISPQAVAVPVRGSANFASTVTTTCGTFPAGAIAAPLAKPR